jgi:hypothetical protein
MAMEVQPGVAIKYIAGEDTADCYNKAVMYSETEGEVLLGTEGSTKFAGIIISVTAGKTEAKDGDNIGVVNDGIIEVKADGAITYGQAIQIGALGKVKALPAVDTAEATAAERTIPWR